MRRTSGPDVHQFDLKSIGHETTFEDELHWLRDTTFEVYGYCPVGLGAPLWYEAGNLAQLPFFR